LQIRTRFAAPSRIRLFALLLTLFLVRLASSGAAENVANHDSIHYLIEGVYYLIDQNQPERAVPYFERAIALDSSQPDAYYFLGVSYYQLKQPIGHALFYLQEAEKRGVQSDRFRPNLSFPTDAVSVFIDGDLIDGLLIRQWVSVREQLSVTLTPSNGKKEVSARFRDAAENESPTTSSGITLNRRAPEILRLTSFDSDQPTNADGIYRSGQQIAIEVQVADALEGLESQLRFTSAKVGYDSGLHALTDEGGGTYRYV